MEASTAVATTTTTKAVKYVFNKGNSSISRSDIGVWDKVCGGNVGKN